MCVHSSGIVLQYADDLEKEIEFSTPHGYESSTGESWKYIDNCACSRGFDFIFDFAHVYMGVVNFEQAFEKLIMNHKDKIPIIYVCDSTNRRDGLPIGEGEIDVEYYLNRLYEENYTGEIIMEVPLEKQVEAIIR